MRGSVVRLAVLSMAFACGQIPADRLPADTARSSDTAVPPGPPSPPAPGPLATRHEAQESFDLARAALIREDYRACVRYLRAASEFMRSHAGEAELGAIAALQGSAKELEFVAERLAKGETPTIRSLDRVLANANRAEAQHHLTRAVAALADRAYRNAGEELLMSVDHIERTARDLRRPYGPDTTTALSEARALARQLLGGRAAPDADSKHVIAQVALELRRLCAVIDVEARACGVEAARSVP
jgi:hypothetical protein